MFGKLELIVSILDSMEDHLLNTRHFLSLIPVDNPDTVSISRARADDYQRISNETVSGIRGLKQELLDGSLLVENDSFRERLRRVQNSLIFLGNDLQEVAWGGSVPQENTVPLSVSGAPNFYN